MPEPNDASFSIGRDQVIRIVSRLFAAYLLFWFFVDITYLPSEILSVAHYLKESSARGLSAATAISASYLLRSYILDLLALLFRMALLLMAAGWFYRCGQRIRRFFGAGAE